MGKFEKGILGHFDGKVGTVVGSTWKGINYMRSKSKKSKKPKTLPQLKQQAKFAVMTRFVGSLGRLLKDSFNDPNNKMTGVNLAVSFNLANAIMGDYPSYGINYSQVLVAKGVQHNVFNPQAGMGVSGMLQWTWTKNEEALAKPDDIAVVVAYCPEMQQGLFTESETRSKEEASLNAQIFTGKLVHTWILFFTADKVSVSSSLYTGEVTVTS